MAKFYSLYIKNPSNVKPEEIEKSNVELMEMKKKFEIENNIADESVKDRVKRLCGSIKERLKDNNQTSLEQLVEDLVDTIIVHNEHFEWKLKIKGFRVRQSQTTLNHI